MLHPNMLQNIPDVLLKLKWLVLKQKSLKEKFTARINQIQISWTYFALDLSISTVTTAITMSRAWVIKHIEESRACHRRGRRSHVLSIRTHISRSKKKKKNRKQFRVAVLNCDAPRAWCVSHVRVQNAWPYTRETKTTTTTARTVNPQCRHYIRIIVQYPSACVRDSRFYRPRTDTMVAGVATAHDSISSNFRANRTCLRSKSIDGYVGTINVNESHAEIFSRISNLGYQNIFECICSTYDASESMRISVHV